MNPTIVLWASLLPRYQSGAASWQQAALGGGWTVPKMILVTSALACMNHDKINPKDCQVLSPGDSGFLQFWRVVSSDYGKPRICRCFVETCCRKAVAPKTRRPARKAILFLIFIHGPQTVKPQRWYMTYNIYIYMYITYTCIWYIYCNLYMYIHRIYIHIYIYTHVYIYIYTYMYTCISIVYLNIYIYLYVYLWSMYSHFSSVILGLDSLSGSSYAMTMASTRALLAALTQIQSLASIVLPTCCIF